MMKHTPADIVAACLQIAAASLASWKFFVNQKPADPLKTIVFTDDLNVSQKTSRPLRGGAPDVFHGVQIMLTEKGQASTARAGNSLMAFVDEAKRTNPQSLVSLPDPDSTEEDPLPAIQYLVENLSRTGGIGLSKEPETGKWVYISTLRATISIVPN